MTCRFPPSRGNDGTQELVKVSDFEEISLRGRYPCFGVDYAEVNPKDISC